MKKIIYAVGIHSEGGLNILNKFINKSGSDVIFYLDKRLKIEKKKNYYFINNDMLSRLFHLVSLKHRLSRKDHILFLNGLPPIVKFNCEVSVAFQNANIFRSFYKINFFKWFFSRDSLRYLFFYFGKENVNSWYVFSPTASKILNNNIRNYVNVKIVNIYNEYKNVSSLSENEIEYDFIYPASYMKHKNHKMLIKILILLSKKNIFPKIIFTLNPNDLKKINFEELKTKYNLKLFNYFETNQKKFLNIYKKCRSLLYMSLNETIGLPIIEAYKYGLFIIAPKLEYSDQFIKPDIVFNIESEKELSSIIENCLKTNFKFDKKSQEIKVLENSINLNDFISRVI